MSFSFGTQNYLFMTYRAKSNNYGTQLQRGGCDAPSSVKLANQTHVMTSLAFYAHCVDICQVRSVGFYGNDY